MYNTPALSVSAQLQLILKYSHTFTAPAYTRDLYGFIEFQINMTEDSDVVEYSTIVKMEMDEEEDYDPGGVVQEDSKEWLDGSEFLPAGWMYKTIHGHTGDYNKLLSPDGKVFNTKLKALNFMMKNNYSEDDVDKMRKSFLYDGWSETNLLPKNWKYRKCKSERNEYQFMAPSGDILMSRRSVLEKLRSSSGITEEDMNKAQQLFDEIKATWVYNLQDYVDDDRSVPPGWRIKYFVGVKANRQLRDRCYILSPSGARFQSRARAVQYMVENNYPQSHTSHMLQQLSLEGWVKHDRLPQHWMIKKRANIKAQGSVLLTSEGFILTVKKAVEHILTNTDKYTTEDAVAVEEVSREMTKERLLNIEHEQFEESDNVPQGWSYRQVTLKNVPFKREYFKTDYGETIKGRVEAIKHLLSMGRGVDDADVLLLRRGLHESGWSEPPDQVLPPGWLQKKILGDKRKKFKYLSPEYLELKSLVDVYHFMKTNNYSVEVIERVGQQLEYKEILRNKTLNRNTNSLINHKWQEAPFLPPNWKFAEKTLRYGNKRFVYLSSSGFMLYKSIEAVMLMVDEGVEEKYLQMMSDRLEHDGWRSHNKLPLGWKYCTEKKCFPDNLVNKETDVVFWSHSFQVFTRPEALKYLIDNNILSEQEFVNFSDWAETGDDWRCDPCLPDGWRLKEILLTEKKLFRVRSPLNLVYNSILEAYNAMVSDNLPADVLEKMKLKLREEGFESSESLPRGWLIIKNRGENLFELLSRDGVVYSTLDSALASMSSDLEYSDNERLDLENLCLDIVEEYLNNRTRTTKGKRKGKLKTSFTPEKKKKRGRKKEIFY